MVNGAPVIRIRDLGKGYPDRQAGDGTLWALRHVSVNIMPGEVWGIIGRNGAGKSTLLKLLSRVTRPSEGNFDIVGKTYSLLELGMGFHPELNGIDNLYVAGAIQGMSRKTIRENLDSIVTFAGIGDAIYQPLRTYSSGMRVRLAFALAAHTHPDILILDEILAVGDEAFQRKCFEAVRTFLKRGVTVLFVSHDMKLVSLICTRCMLLHHGEIIDVGAPEEVIESYSRIIGPGIQRGAVTLTRARHYMQLFIDNFSVTRRFGLYTSVRSQGVWYDPGYILWDEEVHDTDRITMSGHYITVPLGMTWEFRFVSDTEIEWIIWFDIDASLHLDRFQINIMLNHRFSYWFAEDLSYQAFPGDFKWYAGEDWTRHWIGSPAAVIGAAVRYGRWSGDVTFSTSNSQGALTVVTSNLLFKAHVLQYLKVWSRSERLTTGRYRFFSGRIQLKEHR
ncbi:MAG TPA: ABC transporter ATP-binding protein [bacterium]|nr:ABC transporter ATP-binding protein [bacterium]